MKLKKSFISCLMSLVGLMANAQTTLWEATDQENGDVLWWYGMSKEYFPIEVQAGDYITFSITTPNNPGSWKGVRICVIDNTTYDYWSPGTEFAANWFEEKPCVLSFVITDEMVTAIQDLGLFFDCGGNNVTSIVYISKPAIYNIQTQTTPKTVSWWNDNLPANAFAAAQVGDMLTVTVSSINNGASNGYVLVRKNADSGQDFQAQYPTEAGVVKFVIDEDILIAAQAGTLQVQGNDYSYSSIDLVYAPTVNVNAAAEYATFSYSEKLDLTGIEAYAVNATTATSATLESITDKKVAANTGMILYKEGGGDVRIPFATGETDEIANQLIGTATGEVTTSANTYVLANKNNVVGFYKLTSGQTIPTGKAYLTIGGAARQFIPFGMSEVTGIDAVQNNTEENKNAIFDLQGRRVSNPSRGLYITNGKKFIMK